MDETWIHHYIPESNRSSAEWREAGESRSKRVKASRWAVPQKKQINTKPEKQCPTDCPGPFESQHCSYTCFKRTSTGAPPACERTSTGAPPACARTSAGTV
ncbi:hypothetical protein ACLKA6_008479 [Drosophila palustris]